MKNTFLLSCLLVTVVSSASYQCADDQEPRYVNKNIPADFVKDIPVEKDGRNKGQYNVGYQYLNKSAFSLALDSLEGGYDSLQIRIWLGHSMALIKHVVILKYSNKEWKGQLLAYTYGYFGDSLLSIKSVAPQSGWRYLIDSLYKLQVLTLPDGEAIIGGPGADGIGYDFEIATRKKYRYYSYADPDSTDNIWQATNVLKIAKLLEDELVFNYVR